MATVSEDKELTENTVRRFSEIFHGFKNRFGSFEIPDGQSGGKVQGVARTMPGPLILACYTEHLKGLKGLGLIPLLEDNVSAKFGCIDIDKYPIDFKALEKDCANLPVVITQSKSGGAHVWLFAKEPVPARLIQDCLKGWAAALGFGKSEIFPKQIKRMDISDAGNWINLPFFGNTRNAFFNGKTQNLDAFLDYAESMASKMNLATLEHLLKQIEEQPLFHDGPPCLATLASKGITSGSRNMILLNVGSYFKKKDPANFLSNLLDFNKKYLAEPLPESEIHNSVAKSLQRRSYPYQCNQEPLCSACNRPVCLKREFGVGGTAEELEITLTGLTKIDTQPPIWFINIDGVRVEIESFSTILNQRAFRELTAITIHKLFPMIKTSAWEKVVNDLLNTVEVIDAPVDSCFGGQLGDEVREFIQSFAQEESMEQIIAHTVYVNRAEKRAYFRSTDLIRRLKKNVGAQATPQRIWSFLKSHKEYDAQNDVFTIEGSGPIRLWSVSLQYIYIPSTGLNPPPKVLEEKAIETPF